MEKKQPNGERRFRNLPWQHIHARNARCGACIGHRALRPDRQRSAKLSRFKEHFSLSQKLGCLIVGKC